jgi:hypothetical protein
VLPFQLQFLKHLFLLTGWYRAKVLNFDKPTDTVQLEFDVEEGALYHYVVKDEVKARRLKLAKDTQKKVDNYENIFQIGAVVEVNWSKEDVLETDLIPGKLDINFN